jgi:glycosyltransferase involved in cell wall biosynthesis
MTDPKLISVIVPVYNGAKYLAQAVSSVRSIDYSSLEIILVDDASTDESLKIAHSLAAESPHIHVLQHQTNQGPAAARNSALQVARGDIIAFLDVDDEWPEGSFTLRLECLLNNPSIDIALGKVQCLREVPTAGDDSFTVQRELSDQFVSFIIGAAFYRRGVFDKIGVYDPQLRYGEDTDWFMRAREAGIGLLVLPQTTLYYRLHAGGMTNGKSVNELNIVEVLKRSLDRRRQTTNKAPGTQTIADLPLLTQQKPDDK